MDHQQVDRLHRQHRIRHRDSQPVRAEQRRPGLPVWFRALPLGYTDGLAGYEASGGRWFRFVSTTLTVPAATQPASAGDVAMIWLGQNVATPRAYATITVRPGGGAGSVSYAASYGPRSNAGTFGISPKPGDRLAVSVYYDRQGHDYFTASDLTQAVARTARVNADLAGTAYTTAVIGGEISNSAVTPPSADTRLWDFSGSRCHHLQRRQGHHPRPLGHQRNRRHHQRQQDRRGRDEPIGAVERRPELRRLATPPVRTSSYHMPRITVTANRGMFVRPLA